MLYKGNNRQAVFFSEPNYHVYLDCVKKATRQRDIAVYVYVLMANHVYLLVTPQRGDGISKLMQSIGWRYVAYINAAYKRTGTLWRGRYKASLVETEAYLLACLR